MSDKSGPVKIQITDSTLTPARGEGVIFSSWRIAFWGALVFLVALPIWTLPQVQSWVILTAHAWFGGPASDVFTVTVPGGPQILPTNLELAAIWGGTHRGYWEILKFVPDGLIVTFEVTVFSILLATVIGLFAGLGQISRIPVLNRTATVYVEVIRGIPLVVQIFYIYYSLGQFLKVGGVPAAVIAMGVCYGAYMGEVFRAGIQAVPRGQMEAALALGLSRTQALIRVILPQTIRIILPAIGNEFIALLKDSSLVSMLALTDLMQRGRQYAGRTFEWFETFTIVALIYLVITLALSRLVAMLEERMQSRGRAG